MFPRIASPTHISTDPRERTSSNSQPIPRRRNPGPGARATWLLRMLPTPSTSHVPYDRVYEPAEDSYLLLDTLSSSNESSFLKAHFSNRSSPLICEVGTGSGVVLAFVAANADAILGRGDVLALGTDLNIFACACTAQTVSQAVVEHAKLGSAKAAFLGAVNSDLATSLRDKQVDILIFNPPYVPAPLPDQQIPVYHDRMSAGEAFERDSHLLALSYAGGENGMEVTRRLLEELPRVLSANGVAYVLLCAQNRPREVKTTIETWAGSWKAELVGSSRKTAGWEKLVILRVWRE